MKEWNKCPGCGITVSSSADYCPNCGEPWTIKCKNCGKTWRFWKNYKFCPNCGAQVEKHDIIKEGPRQEIPIGKPTVTSLKREK